MSVTTPEWTDVRRELDHAADRFVHLLASVRDPARRAIGTWSIAETAAHVTTVSALDDYSLTGGDIPLHLAHLADLEDQLRTAQIADVARINQLSLERDPERDLRALSDRIRLHVDHALTVTEQSDGRREIAWLGDVQLSEASVLAHLLLELEIHGHDIARASRLSWATPPRAATLGYESFILAAIRSGGHRLLPKVGGDTTFRCEFRVDGTAPVVLDSHDGIVSIEEPGDPVDVRLGGDPVVMISVMFRRISPIGPLLRRRLSISGPRPWRMRRMMHLMQLP